MNPFFYSEEAVLRNGRKAHDPLQKSLHSVLADARASRKCLKIWCARRDSNSRPIAPEAIALSN